MTLRLLGGLTNEVARAFLVAEPTMAKRLVRAKHKIKAAHTPSACHPGWMEPPTQVVTFRLR